MDTDWDTDTDVDFDGDGVPAPADCDDQNAGIYPGNVEICNNRVGDDNSALIDDDCDPHTAGDTSCNLVEPIPVGSLPNTVVWRSEGAYLGRVGGAVALGFGNRTSMASYQLQVDGGGVWDGSFHPTSPNLTFVVGGDFDGDCDADAFAFGYSANLAHVVTRLGSSPVQNLVLGGSRYGFLGAVAVPSIIDSTVATACPTDDLVLQVNNVAGVPELLVIAGETAAAGIADLDLATYGRVVSSPFDEITSTGWWRTPAGQVRIVVSTTHDTVKLITPPLQGGERDLNGSDPGVQVLSVEADAASFANGDLDGDGAEELVVAFTGGHGDGRVYVFDGQELGSLTGTGPVSNAWSQQIVGTGAFGWQAIFGPDYDEDGRADLWISQRSSPEPDTAGTITVIGSRRWRESLIRMSTESWDFRLVGAGWTQFATLIFPADGDLGISGLDASGADKTTILHGESLRRTRP